MLRLFFPVLLSAFLLAPLSAAGGREHAGETVLRVATLSGPSALSMARMVCDPSANVSVPAHFETAGSVDVLLPKLITGDIDIGILPVNVAAKLHAADPGLLVMGAVTGLGMLSVVTRDSNLTRLADLDGKRLYVAGQGATPEYVLRTLLKKAGITNVSLDFSLSTADMAAALASGRISYALLPEPFTTLALERDSGDPPLFRAFLLADLWSEYGFGENFPMTVCVIRRSVAEKNPGQIASFLESYRESLLWTRENPEAAAKCAQKADLGILAEVAEKAIPHSGYTFIHASEARPLVESLLSVYLEYAPAAIGGKLPDVSFYLK